jgi:preprotein translocase SecE subunit
MNFINYLKEVKAETVHISWPSRETLVQHTLLVIGISGVLGVILGLLDSQLGKAVARLVGLN